MSEISELGRELQEAGPKMAPDLTKAWRKGARKFRNDWRANARRTARRHGKHYPRSITAEVRSAGMGVLADIGPESGMPQGGMGRGFEYGSRNQKRPHLDALRASESAINRFEWYGMQAVDKHIPGLE